MNLWLRLLRVRLTARRRGGLSLWDTAVTPFRVAWTDLDPYRHMNNGRYLTIQDLGRLDLLIRSGLHRRIVALGWYPVVAGQTITYRRSLVAGQRYTLHTRIVGLDDRWIYLEQSFHSAGELYARSILRARFLNRSGGSVPHTALEAVTGPAPEGRDVPEWMRAWSAATRFSPAEERDDAGVASAR